MQALNKHLVLELGQRRIDLGSGLSMVQWALFLVAFVVLLNMADVFFDTVIQGLRDENREWLEGDARSFYRIAIGEEAVLEREPLQPMILRASITLFGYRYPQSEAEHRANHVLVRRTTGYIALGMIGMIGLLATRVAGRLAGLASMVVYTSAVHSLFFAITGLRQATMGLLAVTLVWLLILRAKAAWAKVLRYVGIGVCVAALPLVRMSSLSVVPMIAVAYFALGFAWQCGRTGWKRRAIEAVAMIAVAWLAASPFLIACKVHRGRYFSVMVPHAVYYRNMEFAGRPGYPTAREVADNPYTGAEVTPGEYVFGMHTPWQIVRRYVVGYWVSFTKHLLPVFCGTIGDSEVYVGWKLVLYWFWPLGLAWCLWRLRRRVLVVAAMFVVQLPFAFITSLNVYLQDSEGGVIVQGVGYRFSMAMAPFMAVLIGAGLALPLHLGLWLVKRRRKPAAEKPAEPTDKPAGRGAKAKRGKRRGQ